MNKIGRYDIKQEIARGGMGEIYLAEDTNLNREVAIKVLIGALTYETQFIRRFEREARLVAPLEHPNIVPLYDFGVDQASDRPYLVMRLMRGGTLEDRADSLGETELWLMVEQIAAALDYAHKNGVVHRDIKPSNILYDRNGNAYLTDFGIAKSAQSNQTRLTGAKIIGTPHYMSPEQCKPNTTPDGKSDQYSMAILIFELLAGRPPFDGDTMALLYQHVNEDVPVTFLKEKGVDDHVIDALVKALSKEPDDRFPDMYHFVQALLGKTPVGKVTKRARTKRSTTPKGGTTQKANADTAAPGRMRNWIFGGAALVGLLGLASILFNQFAGSDTPTPTEIASEPTSQSEVVPPIVETEAPTETALPPTETPSPTILPTETEQPTETPLPTSTPGFALGSVSIFPDSLFSEMDIIGNLIELPVDINDQFVIESEDDELIEIIDTYGSRAFLEGEGVIGFYVDDDPDSYRFEAHCLVGACIVKGLFEEDSLDLDEGEAAQVNALGEVTALRAGADYVGFQRLSPSVPDAPDAVLAESPTPDQPTPTEAVTSACNYGAQLIDAYTYDNPANNLQAPDGISLRITFILENSGDCEWGSGFTFGPVEDGQFGSSGPIDLEAIVSPNESLTIEVSGLRSPDTPGTYAAVWGVRTAEGELIEPLIFFDLGVYARATATPVATSTPIGPTPAPTIPLDQLQPLDFLFEVGNCDYPGNGTEYRCDLTITAYGGGQGDTYTVWVNDSDPMARYYPVNGPVLHLFQARRCAEYIQEIIVQSDVTGERISKNIYFNPKIEPAFPGGTTCVDN